MNRNTPVTDIIVDFLDLFNWVLIESTESPQIN